MKKIMIAILSVIGILLVIAGGVFGIYLVHKYTPSNVVMEDTEWFGVEGDRVAIVYRNRLQQETGIFADGQIYLPLTWVTEFINERFYWDKNGEQLIYTLPDSIVYAGLSTTGTGGVALIRKSDEKIYLLMGVISTYTDVQLETFVDSGAKRLFIDNRGQELSKATLNKKTAVREKEGIKSKILTRVLKGDEVTVVEENEDWSLVTTADGFIGYVERKRTKMAGTELPISTFTEPVYSNISLDEEICMVWHQVMSAEANDKLEQLLAGTQGINVISPTWFMLTDNLGNYDSLASHSYVYEAHKRGIQVWAALDNFNKGENVRSEILFANTNARNKLIKGLMEEIKAYEIDGINLDIEGIKPEAGSHYVQFIRELSIECRKEGIVLSIDNYVPTAYTAFYNRAEQGRVADYVVMMGYDEHYAGSGSGSVSSFGYVLEGIENTLKEVPKEKIICALPFYTRLWKEDGEKSSSQALGIPGAYSWIEENQVELYWQEELGQYYGELTEGDVKYMIWMEEEKSLTKKLEAVREKGLAGASYWKLGLESNNIWDVVKP